MYLFYLYIKFGMNFVNLKYIKIIMAVSGQTMLVKNNKSVIVKNSHLISFKDTNLNEF